MYLGQGNGIMVNLAGGGLQSVGPQMLSINVSPYGEWRWSPMGLAGRDPNFFAQLEGELAYIKSIPDPKVSATLQQQAINTCMQAGLASSTGTTPHDHADAVLRALESHEVMADVADALSYVIENSEHDTTRFRRAHRILFPNWPEESEDD